MQAIRWQKYAASQLRAQPEMALAWDRLNAQRQDLPFLSTDAMAAALDVFGTGQEQLLVGYQGPAPIAMFVLQPEGPLRWRTFQPSQLPLGSWVAQAGLDLPTLTRSLLRDPLSFCLVLSVTQVDPLQAPRQPDAADTRHADYINTAWVTIEGSFDDYWAARGKNLRQNMRKQRNKLAADGITTTLRVLTTPEDMAAALQRYGAMEGAGWKAGNGTAITADNDQGRFYRRLFEEAAQRGEARVYEYLFNDHTAAINLGLLRNGVLTVLKTTYDESIPKALSPAFLLREEELQLYFAGQDVRRIEYYGKVMDWHTKLTDCKRTLYHLTAYRWPLLKRLAARRQATAVSEPTGPLMPSEQP